MTKPLRLGVLASGRGSNLEAIIKASRSGRLNAVVVLVVSDRADARALKRAQRWEIEGIHLSPKSFPDKEAYEGEIVRLFKARGVELVVLAGYMRIVGPTLLLAFPQRVMNIHPALLPSFPGLEAQRQALEHGVKVSGCTVHFVDAGVDTGPIILQRAVPVRDDDTVDSLSARILRQEHKIYPAAIQLFAEGRLVIQGRRVRILEQAARPGHRREG